MEEEHREKIKGPCETIWLKRIVADLILEQTKPIIILCHNLSVLKLARNPMFRECTKHIDVHLHFIRHLVESEEFQLQYCTIEQ